MLKTGLIVGFTEFAENKIGDNCGLTIRMRKAMKKLKRREFGKELRGFFFGMAECEVAVQDFVRTGRTGRRNAMPDVLAEQHIRVSTAGLAEVLESINFGASTSGQSSQAEAATGSSQQASPS